MHAVHAYPLEDIGLVGKDGLALVAAVRPEACYIPVHFYRPSN